jgi:hypothetical protein
MRESFTWPLGPPSHRLIQESLHQSYMYPNWQYWYWSLDGGKSPLLMALGYFCNPFSQYACVQKTKRTLVQIYFLMKASYIFCGIQKPLVLWSQGLLFGYCGWWCGGNALKFNYVTGVGISLIDLSFFIHLSQVLFCVGCNHNLKSLYLDYLKILQYQDSA